METTMKRPQPTSEQYRAAALRLFPAPDGKEITVPQHASVHPIINEGAYVAMTVWVPIDEAEKESER